MPWVCPFIRKAIEDGKECLEIEKHEAYEFWLRADLYAIGFIILVLGHLDKNILQKKLNKLKNSELLDNLVLEL